MKRTIIASISILVFALLSWVLFLKQNEKNDFIVEKAKISESSSETEENQNEQFKNENHPNSILNLTKKDFNGDGFEVGRVLSQTPEYTRYYISYQSDGLKISGIMNAPKGKGPFPVLILNHGYIDPDIYTNGRGLKREQDYFAQNGYVVIHPDYRGHAESDPDPESGDEQGLAYSGYTTDVLNAISAVKKAGLSYVDAERIGMLGHSMGGGVTMNALIASPSSIDAAILYAPVSSDYQKNFFRWRKRVLTDEEVSIMETEIGNTNDQDAFLAFSSATYFHRIEAPIMIHHGTTDQSVPVEWSQETKEGLEAAGKSVIYHEYPSEPHEFATSWPLFMKRSLDFFDENLK